MRTALFLLLLPAWAAPAEAETGVVLGVVGAWTRGDTPIRFGDLIPISSNLRASQPGALMIEFKEKPVLFRCQDAPCHYSFPQDKPGFFSAKSQQFLAAVRPLISRSPERFIAAVSRGLGADLEEAILLIRGELDVSPALRNLSEGTYWLRLDVRAGPPIPVHWKPGKSALISAERLTPGLCRMTLTNEAGDPISSEAWVLLSAPENYEKLRLAFQDAVETTTQWKDALDESSTRAVLRAYLQTLAEPGKLRR